MNNEIRFLTHSINNNFENMAVTRVGECVTNCRQPHPAWREGGRAASQTSESQL